MMHFLNTMGSPHLTFRESCESAVHPLVSTSLKSLQREDRFSGSQENEHGLLFSQAQANLFVLSSGLARTLGRETVKGLVCVDSINISTVTLLL